MVHPAAKRSMCEAGLVPLFLERLPTALPALCAACLDSLLALQLNYAPAFQELVALGGMQQVGGYRVCPPPGPSHGSTHQLQCQCRVREIQNGRAYLHP